MTFLTILPMAFVMNAGPQVISSVLLATSVNWLRNSAAYVAGAAVSISLVVTAAYFITKEAKGGGGSSASGGTGDAIDIVLLVLLLFLAVRVYLRRDEAETPKWMGKLQTATPKFSFRLGFTLLGVFPTDIITSVTVGTKVAREGDSWLHTVPFILLTLFLLALPLLLVLVLGARAEAFLPQVRDWMNANSWMVSEVVILLFIGIQISSIAGD
jgi:hypothetical protein